MAIFSAITSQLVLIGWNVFGLTSLAAATTFANIVIGAALLGVSALGQTMARQPSMRTSQAQAVINQSTGPRVRGYGRAKLGGTRAFFDSKSGRLYQVIMAHSGEIDAWEQFYVGDIAATLNGSGDATNSGLSWTSETSGTQRAVRILPYLGTDDQAADSLMSSVWSQWTSEHRLRGIAYFVARFRSPPAEDLQKVFPESYNTPVRGRARLSKVYDPREPGHDPEDAGTWAWSENASLCILDYLTHPDGMRLTKDDCDLDSFAAFADLCDEAVAKADGGTEMRYRLWGVYQLTDEPDTVIQAMRRTCDAEFFTTPEGKIGIRGGQWSPPTVTLDETSILAHSMEQGNNRLSTFNELKITYTSPLHDYQAMEATAWADLADQAERGPIPSSLDLDYVPSPSQARRLAKIHVAKANPAWKGRVRCSLAALDAWDERTVRLVIPELQIDDAFYISRIELAPDLAGVEMEVVSISEAAYAWSTAEEGENPALPQETSPDLEFPVPANLVLTEPTGGQILATVDDPDRDDIELEVEVRLGAGSLWQAMQGVTQTTAIFEPAAAGTWQARARWRGPQSTVGEWSSPLAEIIIT
jgi:hypothetical protein